MTQKNYALVTSLEELQGLVDRILAEGKPFGFDLETGYDGPDKSKASLHTEENFIVGFSLTNSTEWARYAPLRHDYATENLDPVRAAEIIWPLLSSGLMIAHNAKFESRNLSVFFKKYLPQTELFADFSGTGYFPIYSDSMVEAYVVGDYKECGLKPLNLQVFNHKMTELKELFPDTSMKEEFIRFNILPLTPEVIAYACEDALWCLALSQKHLPAVKDTFVYKLEMQIIPILCEMEDFGVQLDWDFLMKASMEAKEFLQKQYAEIQAILTEILGRPVAPNLASSQQVSKILYEEMGLVTTRMTKASKNTSSPKMSTDANALKRLAKEHVVVKKLVQWREIKKLIGSYLDKYERDYRYDLKTDRSHPSLKQCSVITGRFSGADPNYQQLPKKYEYRLDNGEEFNLRFRNCVVSPPGYYFAGFDFSQIELRVMAGEAQETDLMDAFARGIDIHDKTAAMVLGIPVEEVTEEQREKFGKLINFAVGYGLGLESLAERLAISEEEAQGILDRYFEAAPKLKAFIEQQERTGRRFGFVVNRWGRKMTVWEYQSPHRWVRSKGDRASFNYVIQSAGTGDLPKIAMLRSRQALEKAGLLDKVHLVMNVHDELNYYVHESVDFFKEFVPTLTPAVVFPVEGWPAVEVEWHRGQKWGELTEYKVLSDGSLMDKVEWKRLQQEKSAARAQSGLQGQVIVEMWKMPSQAQFAEFVSLVRGRPGLNSLKLVTPSGTLSVSTSTGVGPEVHDQVSAILGGATVRYVSSYANDVDEINDMQFLGE